METLESGAAFGPYTIEGLVAAGGMGQVYAARHEVYGSVVALKVLHKSLDEKDDWRKRFQEEGLVGTQLKHPNVLSAREVVDQDGQAAIVMDLVKGGQTLEKIIAREFPNGLPLVQGLQLFLTICQGIDYLHGKGVIHGDLKPENVMIAGDYRRPETWDALITDFGTVGLLAHPVVIDGRTAVVATPRYASPEHLRGTDRLEVRSDVYCLGLMLHHILSGKHCSDARTVRESASFVTKEVPVVALVDQPEPIIEVFKKATRVKAKDRYDDCRDLALAVRQVLDTMGVSLELEDVAADLATEVDEERAEAQRKMTEAAKNEAQPSERDPDAPTELDSVQIPHEKGKFPKGSKSEVTLEPDELPEELDEDVDKTRPPEPDDLRLDTGMEVRDPTNEEEEFEVEKTAALPRSAISKSSSTSAPGGLAVILPLALIGVGVLVVLGLITFFVL